jgi:hypothetical protein
LGRKPFMTGNEDWTNYDKEVGKEEKKENEKKFRFGGERELKMKKQLEKKKLTDKDWTDYYNKDISQEKKAELEKTMQLEKKPQLGGSEHSTNYYNKEPAKHKFGGEHELTTKLAFEKKMESTNKESIKTDPFDDYQKRNVEEIKDAKPVDEKEIIIKDAAEDKNDEDDEIFDEEDVRSAIKEEPVPTSTKEDLEFATSLAKEENDWFNIESDVIRKLQRLNKNKPVALNKEDDWEWDRED